MTVDVGNPTDTDDADNDGQNFCFDDEQDLLSDHNIRLLADMIRQAELHPERNRKSLRVEWIVQFERMAHLSGHTTNDLQRLWRAAEAEVDNVVIH